MDGSKMMSSALIDGRGNDLEESDNGQVRIQLGQLRETMDMLYKDYHVLAVKTRPVQMEDRPKVSDSNEERARVELVPVADDIYHIDQMLRQLHHQLADLADRISI